MFLAAQSSDLFAGGRSSRGWYIEIFARLNLATCSQVEGLVVGVHRNFHGLPCDFLTGRTSSCEKHLENFSRFLS